MHWLFLTLAILFEVAGTTTMKLSNGLSKIIPSVLMIVFYISSLSFLTLALKNIEISIAYAIWSGVGIALITIIGYIYFAENLSIVKIIAISLIIIGIITLNLAGNVHASSSKVQITEDINQ
ncbi:DMT family transporter [Heyndrickxia sp. NPDC080065]|uniref:DMT family transporter n=1 Tax=Heyndrickxia sp. NPDC080065 TaxID=3390568 RepID=UPI003D063CD9